MQNTDIAALVQNFANDLSNLVRRAAVEQMIAQLGGSAAVPAQRGPGRPRIATKEPTAAALSVARIRKDEKRTPEAVMQMGERLLAYVKSKPGMRAEQIAKVFHSDVKTIRLPMQRLIAEKKLTTKGQRRGMTYYAAAAAAPKAAQPAKKKVAAKKAKRAARPIVKAIRKTKAKVKPVRARKTAHRPKVDAKSTVKATQPRAPEIAPKKPVAAVLPKVVLTPHAKSKPTPKPASKPVAELSAKKPVTAPVVAPVPAESSGTPVPAA